MQLYLSFSYRDLSINSHFLGHFVDEDIPLQADKKTDVWCVPKLERSLCQVDGFVSIIPRRQNETDPGAYSEYIHQEVNLARRARVPRLLFIDELVYKRHRLQFPEDVIAFSPGSLDEQGVAHREAIRAFRQTLERTWRTPVPHQPRHVTLVGGRDKRSVQLCQDLAELLRREGFTVAVLVKQFAERGLADIGLLEALWRSELCVFALGERLSDANIALAMAHAHCIPSFRLQYDDRATECKPAVNGVIRWKKADDLLVEFGDQLTNYLRGLVRADELARASGSAWTAQLLAVSDWHKRLENQWNVTDTKALLPHVRPEHRFVKDQIHRVFLQLKAESQDYAGRPGAMELCRFAYDAVKRLGMSYGLEHPTSWQGEQAIRTITQIETHRTATCIDVACLFASLLEAGHQNALVIILDEPGFAHALAGYRAPDEPAWNNPSIGDLRRAASFGDAVIFEATGVLDADMPVGAETTWERREKTMVFSDAVLAGTRMLEREGVQVRGVLDVHALRAAGVSFN
jgi:hypothetical protein